MSARFHAGPPDAVNSSAAELTIAEQPPENRVVFLQRADRANGGLWRTAAPTHVLAIATVARAIWPLLVARMELAVGPEPRCRLDHRLVGAGGQACTSAIASSARRPGRNRYRRAVDYAQPRTVPITQGGTRSRTTRVDFGHTDCDEAETVDLTQPPADSFAPAQRPLSARRSGTGRSASCATGPCRQVARVLSSNVRCGATRTGRRPATVSDIPTP